MAYLAPRFHWRLFWICFLTGVIVATVLLKVFSIQTAQDEYGEASPLVGMLIGSFFAPAIKLTTLVDGVLVPLHRDIGDLLGYLFIFMQITVYAAVLAAKEFWKDPLRPGHGKLVAVVGIVLHVGCVVWLMKYSS